MNNKKVNQEERKKEIKEREELDSLLENVMDNVEFLSDEASDYIKKRKVIQLDYEKIKEDIEKESDEIVKTSIHFFFEEYEIKNEPYIQQKIKVDKITVSNLLFQMKTAEHAIIKLLEKIDEGNTHPREFEVLSSLQRSKMEIVKHLSSFMVVMENNYKTLRNEYLIKISEGRVNSDLQITDGSEKSEDEGENLRVRGHKNLIKEMEKAKKEMEKNIEDIKDENDNNEE